MMNQVRVEFFFCFFAFFSTIFDNKN